MSFLKGKFKWIFSIILTVFLMMSSFLGCNLEEINSFLGEEETTTVQNQEKTSTQNEDETSVQKQDNNSKESEDEKSLEVFENKEYSSKEEVSAYINKYNKLPSNYITKKEAENLGWESSKGNLWDVVDGKSIGGDKFGNREGLLPKKSGRQYYECDIDYNGGYRGAKRIIYSNDGLIYYTEDHYKTFEQLY
ncbi:MAG: ribonuclease domain-containing protein [Clostridium sp.]